MFEGMALQDVAQYGPLGSVQRAASGYNEAGQGRR
jgi:hypothetical protein